MEENKKKTVSSLENQVTLTLPLLTSSPDINLKIFAPLPSFSNKDNNVTSFGSKTLGVVQTLQTRNPNSAFIFQTRRIVLKFDMF